MQFHLRISQPLPATQIQTVLDLDSDTTAIAWSTSDPGGFNGCDIGYVDPGIPGLTYLPDDLDIGGFYDVELRAGRRVVFKGRIQRIVKPGGVPRAFTATGYGLTHTKDRPFDQTTELRTAGAFLQAAVNECCPLLTIPNPSLFVDTNVPHVNSDFYGLTTAQLLDAITKEGGPSGQPWSWLVWDDLQARFHPQQFTLGESVCYQIDADSSVNWEETFDDSFGAISYLYTPNTANASQVLYAYQTDPYYVDVFGVDRRGVIDVSNVAPVNQLQYALRALDTANGPITAITVSRSKDDGMRTVGGALVPCWLVRAGQWLKIGESGPYPIIHTDYNAATGEFTAQVQGYPQQFLYNYLNTQAIANYVIAGVNPTTGQKL